MPVGQNGGSYPGERRGGRKKGTPNRDKKPLRDAVARAVLDFTTLRRQQDIQNGITPDEAQPVLEDYCPVVQLALAGSDNRNPAALRVVAHGQAAKFLRPTLKAIEHTNDPNENESRRDLSAALMQLIADRAAPTSKEEESIYDRGGDTKDT